MSGHPHRPNGTPVSSPWTGSGAGFLAAALGLWARRFDVARMGHQILMQHHRSIALVSNTTAAITADDIRTDQSMLRAHPARSVRTWLPVHGGPPSAAGGAQLTWESRPVG